MGARDSPSMYETLTTVLIKSNGTTVQVDVPKCRYRNDHWYLLLGSYIQAGNEIMRVKSATLSGSAGPRIGVLFVVLFGSVQENHSQGSVIRKIEPIAVEFRRPLTTILGHTFEYACYGPGNYSTSHQVQARNTH
ncbi:MAG: hypothetical protein CM15mV26_1300 [uncultured marine virus]|nr:MAG: hypothetical protein CM15mV26_1300 [uncultured marine virus]